ncbi:bile acid receptor-like isoform X2 [Anneissia japonica]|nr:bile acid receptor-like isoform X2 [Anneissia japonica]
MNSKDERNLKCRLCLVCGDTANGVHYNVLSCEGCKSFFLRSIKSNSVFKCTQGGNCSMDLYTRRHCPACRLAKCRNLGMSEAKVWGKSRLGTRKALVRKVGKKKKQDEKHLETPVKEILPKTIPVQPTAAQIELVNTLENAYQASKTICREYLTKAPKMKSTNRYTLVYESGPESGTGSGSSSDDTTSANTDENQQSSSSQIEICPELRKYAMDSFAISVRQTIFFARGIPGFTRLTSNDQAALVRAGILDSLLLRLSEFFVVEENKIVNDLGDEYDLKMMSDLGLPTFSGSSFKFLKQIKALGLTTAEYSLMNAASLLAPDRDEVTNRELVEELQLPIIMAMQAVAKTSHPDQPSLFPDLIVKLATMREISLIHQQDLMKMKLLKQDFTPLVAELFNLQ